MPVEPQGCLLSRESFFTCIFNIGCLSFRAKSIILLSAEVAYRFLVIGSGLINLPVSRGNDNNIIFSD